AKASASGRNRPSIGAARSVVDGPTETHWPTSTCTGRPVATRAVPYCSNRHLEGVDENNISHVMLGSRHAWARYRMVKRAQIEQAGRPGRKPALNAGHIAVLRAIT